MSVCPTTTDTLCDCCTGIALETPERIVNAPALAAIGYRVGRWATFNASMLASLSQSAYTPMGLLRTRESTDFSIALLDAWAVALDILTFYQERFANEAFLRTALDTRSVFELARLIGYVPSPGVAASDVLAFTLADAPGSPDPVLIPAGTRVQSVPGPGQTAQMFETSADLVAQIGYNALPAQTTQAWQLTGENATWIAGTANNVNVGDLLLFVAAAGSQPVQSGPADAHFVTAVNADAQRGVTQLQWDSALSSDFPAGTTADAVCLYVLHKKAALYGVQAPDPALLSNNLSNIGGAPSSGPVLLEAKTVKIIPPVFFGGSTDWSYSSYVPGSWRLNLDAAYAGLAPAAGVDEWAVFYGTQGSACLLVTTADESNPNRYTLTTKTTRLTFAWGAPLGGTVSDDLDTALAAFENDTRNVTVYVDSAQLQPAALPLTEWDANPGYWMDPALIAPVGGSSVSLVGGQRIALGQAIGVAGQRVRLQVLPGAAAQFVPEGSLAATAVPDNQVFLVDAWPPLVDESSGTPLWSVETASGVAGALLVPDAFVQLLPAASGDAPVREASDVAGVAVQGDVTTLSLGGPLTRLYDAATVTVNANAVWATHGETVQEILGSGDATNPALTFTLKQSPLTYVSSTAQNGTQSTLQVWVNNLRWQEAPNLLASGPADRVFVTRVNEAGFTVIQFGDGVNGARPPTGQMNIRAVYRKGIGSAGMVASGQLSQAIDRPQGLRSAVNPSAAAGGADPATAADARARAPLPTLTIGRVVSLEDYQNYALNFAGIAKAIASWTWARGRRGVFLTVAGANGATFAPTDDTILNLIASLRQYGNPYVPLTVASYEPVPFEMAANVRVDPAYDTTLVLAAAWQNLAAAFSFAARQPGQSVAASDVVSIVQLTPGVLAMQLTALCPSGDAALTVPPLLCAAGPQPPLGAQMLLIDPASEHAIGVWS
ncbi:putative baseplate assembly protein [Paraburkholderia unamae]|uniref:Phage baseplate assembly protein n=1 Tax=Paraburkholderia unamae TaxID=219649 RepID=A0ABX5KRB4_9BURK|nr:putative baseplate assembly protein [Paraburkholderia unamae]PVX85127.1 putative phage baseplate assembly protein [Paraburkholderia unamae]